MREFYTLEELRQTPQFKRVEAARVAAVAQWVRDGNNEADALTSWHTGEDAEWIAVKTAEVMEWQKTENLLHRYRIALRYMNATKADCERKAGQEPSQRQTESDAMMGRTYAETLRLAWKGDALRHARISEHDFARAQVIADSLPFWPEVNQRVSDPVGVVFVVTDITRSGETFLLRVRDDARFVSNLRTMEENGWQEL